MSKKRTTEEPTEGIPVEIQNLDGIGQLGFVLKHGMTELWAGNGGHKSRARAALQDAAGRKRDVSVGVTDDPRDGTGALSGTASVGGRTLRVSRSGAVQRDGSMMPSIQIVDSGPVSRLIDPGLKEEQAKRNAQLRAFLELVPLPASEENLKHISSGDQKILDKLLPLLEEKGIVDLLPATKKMRTMAQEDARIEEADATAADRSVQAKAEVLEELTDQAIVTTKPLYKGKGEISAGWVVKQLEKTYSLLELQGSRREADNAAGAISARREEYIAALERQKKLKETAGDRPSDEVLAEELEASRRKIEKEAAALDQQNETVTALEKELEKARSDMREANAVAKGTEEALRAQQRALSERREEMERWDESHEFLAQELSGPTAEEVEEAVQSASESTALLETARLARRYVMQVEEKAALQKDQIAAEERGEELRAIESKAWVRLGELVTKVSKVPEVTIHQGWVAYVDPETGEVHDWNSKYVSTGMRNGAAFRLGATCFGADSILDIDGQVYEMLDLNEKLALHKVCQENRVFGISEVASFSDDELTHVQVGSPAWVQQFKELAEAAAKVASDEKD